MWVVLSLVFVMYIVVIDSDWTLTCDGAWTLDCGGHKVASWTLKGGRLPSIQAVLAAKRLYEQWDNYCGWDIYSEFVPFKTYRPLTGPEFEAEVHSYYERQMEPPSTDDPDDTF